MNSVKPEKTGNRSRFHISNRVKASAVLLTYLSSLVIASEVIGNIWPSQHPEPAGGFAQTVGVIEATYPSQHDEIRYRYMVAGRSYERTWFADGPEGHAQDLALGQTITVWYEAAQPSVSCSCVDPHEMLRTNNDTTPQNLAAFLLLTAGFVALAGRLLYGRWLSIFEAVRRLLSTQDGHSALPL